eukprot:scaffold270176_cov35-Tisochrysis_lutea.AAC.3
MSLRSSWTWAGEKKLGATVKPRRSSSDPAPDGRHAADSAEGAERKESSKAAVDAIAEVSVPVVAFRRKRGP